MEKQDMELANKLNTDLSMAIESGSILANKMKNSNLKKYLFSHIEKYENLQDQLNKIVSTNNKQLKSTNFVSKAFLWMQAQLTSLSKNEESDYIESFIKGSEMGLDSSYKLLVKYKKASDNIKDIVSSLKTIELENIDKLSDYLKRSQY